MADITELAALSRVGNHDASNQLFALAYKKLKSTAAHLLRREVSSRTITPTVLVHESYMKLDLRHVSVLSRDHFFNLSARAMRQVLADRGRARQVRARYDVSTVARFLHPHHQSTLTPEQHHALHTALETLRSLDPLAADTIWLRFAEELTLDELAIRQNRKQALVRRDSDFALKWLAHYLNTR